MIDWEAVARARAEALERLGARLQALAETSHAFAEATTDYPRIFETIARRAAELLGDVCMVRLVSDDGEWLPLVGYHHRDPRRHAETAPILKAMPQRATEGIAGRVVQTGRPLLLAEVPPAALPPDLPPEAREYLERYPHHSVVAAPLRSQGRVIGVMTLARHDRERPYDEDDLRVIEDVAERASMAVSNARLFAELRREREEINAALRAEVASRAAAEEQLRAQGLFLDSIIENIPDMIFVKDAAELRFVRFNRAGEELLGYDRADLLGKNDYDFFPQDEAEYFTRKDREVLAGRAMVDIASEPIHTRRKGPRLLHTKKIPLLGGDGQPRYLLGISEDITEMTRMRAALAQSERLASLGLLSAGIAHEINNPLAYVANDLHVLERDATALLAIAGAAAEGLDALSSAAPDVAARLRALAEAADLAYLRENLARLLGRARDGVRRVTRIVDSLRTLARTDAVKVVEADLGALVDACLEMMRGRLARRGVEVQVEVGDGRVRCAPTLLTQALLNLLTNAMHAVEEARPEGGGRIRVASWREGGERVIEVSDNGAGIDPAVLPRIFDPFFTTKPVGEGTGLGLAITHSIVEGHGGRLGVESAPGQGARFRIHLPLDPVEGAA